MDNIKSNLYSKNNTSEIKNKKEEELQKLQSVINQLKNTLCVKKDSFSINNISQYSIRSKSQGNNRGSWRHIHQGYGQGNGRRKQGPCRPVRWPYYLHYCQETAGIVPSQEFSVFDAGGNQLRCR